MPLRRRRGRLPTWTIWTICSDEEHTRTKTLRERDKMTAMETIRRAILLDENGDTPSAVKLLEELNHANPNRASIGRYLAWFLSHAGRHAEAVLHARRSTQLASESELSSLALFHVLWDAGDRDLAIEEAERFQKISYCQDYDEILSSFGVREEADDRNRRTGNLCHKSSPRRRRKTLRADD